MSVINSIPLIAAGDDGYKISRSVRFRSSASAYLNRTPASAGNRQKFTWAGWIKRGALSNNFSLFSAGTTSPTYDGLRFDPSDRLQFFQGATVVSNLITTQVFRDPSAWYHIVLSVDTTQTTASSRVVMYVNGTQITAFGTATYPAQNTSASINNNLLHVLGAQTDSGVVSVYFDGYMTEVNFIDGQALTPSSFGETNSVTGVWQPKKYAGTYGTNGFYLNFSDNSGATATTIGKDYSGNGNNWTPNNISVTAGVTYDSMVDSPTVGATSSNYATFNPIAKASSQPTFSNGNLNLAASSAWNGAVGTIGVTSGKWYWEVVNGNADSFVGICGDNLVLTTADPQTLTGTIVYYGGSGSKRIDGTDTAYGASYSTETIGVALDVDGGTITFYKNNTSQGSISLSSSTLNGKTIFPFFVKYASTTSINFGQRPFSYTPPTGFLALNTQNLPAPTISNGAQYMAATTYTANASTQVIINSINGIGFQPDLVWTKSRTGAYSHELFDVIRGVNAYMGSNQTAAEIVGTAQLTSFNSNGFTLGANENSNFTNGYAAVAWQWKAGGTAVSNTAGSITSTVSANPTAGFSVVTYTGTGTTGATVGHGLGAVPQMIIVKNRSAAAHWPVGHVGLTSWGYNLYLSLTNAQAAVNTSFNSTTPTSTVFTLGPSGGETNFSGQNFVAYCFTGIAGYSAFGKYTGNGSSDGPFVFLGFRPRWVMIKRSSSTSSWYIYDSSRNTYNVIGEELYAESASAAANRIPAIDFLSNGFKLRCADAGLNASGDTEIYAAFAENPFKNSNAR